MIGSRFVWTPNCLEVTPLSGVSIFRLIKWHEGFAVKVHHRVLIDGVNGERRASSSGEQHDESAPGPRVQFRIDNAILESV